METSAMVTEAKHAQQPAPINRPPNPKKKRKQPQHTADIVFFKGNTFLTMPSLSKILKDITDSIIGLQNVWEYRSPSRSVPPHYMCKLCGLSRTQHDMVDHVKGWRHSFRYMKRAHPDKITCEEEDGVKDPAVRKTIKAAAAEVEMAEGRGQIRVILKEPYLVPAFKGLRSAAPKGLPPPSQMKGSMGPPFGPRFQDARFPGEFTPHGRIFPDLPGGEYKEPGYGGQMPRQGFPDRGMGPGPFSDCVIPGRPEYGNARPVVESSNVAYPDQFQENFLNRTMDKPVDRPRWELGAAPQMSNMSAILKHLDSFRIENENEAQLVLKVTQKLTDVLMEYRLRNIPAASTFMSNSLAMGSTDFSNGSSRFQGDKYSSNHSGPSRYPNGPQRYFN